MGAVLAAAGVVPADQDAVAVLAVRPAMTRELRPLIVLIMQYLATAMNDKDFDQAAKLWMALKTLDPVGAEALKQIEADIERITESP